MAMTRWLHPRTKGLQGLALAASLAGFVGCGGGKSTPPAASTGDANPPAVSVPSASAATTEAAVATAPVVASAFPADAMHLPFAKATRGGDDPPAMCNRPPDMTVTNKPVGKLYEEVVRLWSTIGYVNSAGKPLVYSATVETDQGTIEIALRPDVAPNHVRNFIALAKAGYYDGLRFDRVRHEEPENPANGPALDLIEAGCPLGTGEPGFGSIGYWLNPEFDNKEKPKLTHEDGIVGACRGMEADSAACRFYVTLSKAPYLDGNYTGFGKVTKGLDVAHRIYQQPGVVTETEPDGSRRPLTPVTIHKVTIHVHEADGSEGQH
jgi:peptidyl-prolyl cis-trans isomerase B (cyclophilin B)